MTEKLTRKGTRKSKNDVCLHLVKTILAIIIYFILNSQININGHLDFSLGSYKKTERQEAINSIDNASNKKSNNDYRRRKLRETYCERKR